MDLIKGVFRAYAEEFGAAALQDRINDLSLAVLGGEEQEIIELVEHWASEFEDPEEAEVVLIVLWKAISDRRF